MSGREHEFAFTVGTCAYVVSGVPAALSGQLGVSRTAAGQLATAFAIAHAMEPAPTGGLTLSLNAAAIDLGTAIGGMVDTTTQPGEDLHGCPESRSSSAVSRRPRRSPRRLRTCHDGALESHLACTAKAAESKNRS